MGMAVKRTDAALIEVEQANHQILVVSEYASGHSAAQILCRTVINEKEILHIILPYISEHPLAGAFLTAQI